MFRGLRRLFKLWKKSLYDSYEQKPIVYQIGKKKFVKVKRLNTSGKRKGPYAR
jgi:hypothetical protein